MPRKSKSPIAIEDTDRQSISLTCSHCHEQFTKTGAWLKEHDLFACPNPNCGKPIRMDYEKRLKLISDHVKKLRDALGK
jgi:hypothetical protein